MRFIVYGAGGIGGLVAARLHQSGHEVLAVARGVHADRMHHDGLTVESGGERTVVRLNVTNDISSVRFQDDDLVLLAVKGQDTQAALARLPAIELPIVCLQNGVENERVALRRYERVYGAYVFCPVTFLEPGVVAAEFSPIEGIIDVGRYPSGADDLASSIAAALDATTFSSRASDAIMQWKYGKLLGNVANIVQAIARPGDGDRELIEAARVEGIAVLAAASIDWADDAEQAVRRDGIAARAGGGRAGGSTWQSFQRGVSIETDFLNGEIALLGRLHNLPTPINALLQQRGDELIRAGAPAGSLSATALLREARAAALPHVE